jgi:hypothetical protein
MKGVEPDRKPTLFLVLRSTWHLLLLLLGWSVFIGIRGNRDPKSAGTPCALS